MSRMAPCFRSSDTPQGIGRERGEANVLGQKMSQPIENRSIVLPASERLAASSNQWTLKIINS